MKDMDRLTVDLEAERPLLPRISAARRFSSLAGVRDAPRAKRYWPPQCQDLVRERGPWKPALHAAGLGSPAFELPGALALWDPLRRDVGHSRGVDASSPTLLDELCETEVPAGGCLGLRGQEPVDEDGERVAQSCDAIGRDRERPEIGENHQPPQPSAGGASEPSTVAPQHEQETTASAIHRVQDVARLQGRAEHSDGIVRAPADRTLRGKNRCRRDDGGSRPKLGAESHVPFLRLTEWTQPPFTKMLVSRW